MSEDILNLNHLSYSTPESLQCSKKTTRTQYPIYSNRYDDCKGGEVLQIPFENIPECCYIDGSKSSISLKISINVPKPTAADDVWFWSTDRNTGNAEYANTGSTIVNLIKSAVHQRDNNEILYRENFLYMMQTIREYSQSLERKRVLTEVGGYVVKETKYNLFAVNKNTSFNIPLYLISPFWDSAALIPSRLLKNSKLSLLVNSIKDSLIGYGRDATTVQPFPNDVSVTFSEMSLNLYQTELYDELHRNIKNEIVYFPYYSNNNDIHLLNSSNIMINIPLQSSKLSYVALKFRSNDNLSPIDAAEIKVLGDAKTKDNNYLPIKIQARINGMIFPTFPINDSVQGYIESINALQNISYPNAQNVDELKIENKLMGGTISYYQFCHSRIDSIGPPPQYKLFSGYSSGGVIFAIDLQKSNNVSLSGVEVNASRNLTIEIEGLDNWQNLTLFSQVRYMNVATIDKDKDTGVIMK
jgi:hypothetical protein